MKSPLSISVPLVTLLSTVALVSAIPQATPTLTSLSPSAPPTNASHVDASDFECIRNRNPMSMRNLVLRQCLNAIALLPTGDQQVTFRGFGEKDDTYLPQNRLSESCVVYASLDYGYDTELGSWTGLRLLATRLAHKCCSLAETDNLLEGNREGYVPGGLHGKIRMVIAYSRLEKNGIETTTTLTLTGNSTNIATDAVLAA